MALSTSSSDTRSLRYSPRYPFIAGCLLAFVVLALLEFGLRYNGMQPLNLDTKELWAAQRARASYLGKDGLILVGASRIQLDVDLRILEEVLQLTPVQLAIDGTSFLPVLENLAEDPRITGTIIVSLQTGAIRESKERFKSTEWVEFYNREYRNLLSPVIEKHLKSEVKSLSNIYSSGIPLHRLLEFALGFEAPPRYYLTTDTRRERDADYTMVRQPQFYLARAVRHLGRNVDMRGVFTLGQAIQRIRDEIPPPRTSKIGKSNYTYINSLTKKLRKRGARVIFVRFPTSGLVWEIDQARLPKKYCWDQFAKYSIAPTIHFMDYPELQYQLADGSHLDKLQKQEFTGSLARIIRQKLSQ